MIPAPEPNSSGLSLAFVLVSVVVGSSLIVLVTTILGRGIVEYRRDRRRDRVRDTIRTALLERLDREDPDWGEWTDGLDRTERAVLRELLDSYLRRFRGHDRRTLQDAAAALGLVDWATAAVGSADRYRQLEGLTWLLLLDTVADDLGVRRRCRGHRDTRAAGARVLYECDHPNAVRAGTELLLDATEPLSVLGLDTLYRLHDRDPAHLVAYANANHRNWPASLTIQVLRAFGECNPVSDDVSLDWAFDLLDADSPRVRAAAVAALGEYGWRTDVGDRLQTAAPTADAAPVVRRAAYSTLGEWGNTDAVRQLAAAVVVDPDPRCRLAAARALPDGAEGDERGAIEPVETDGSFPGPADGTASLDDAPALEWVAERAEPGS
jgi:HEAT repeat protein